jgi:hypothetical protein
MHVRVQPHATNKGQEGMLDMEGGRRKILKQATSELKRLGALREGRHWQKGEGEHGRGARSADVPLEGSPMEEPAWVEEQLPRTNGPSFQFPLAQLGHCFHGLQVLGAKPRRVASGPDIGEVQVLASEGRQRDPKAHNGPTPGKAAAIEVKHGCLGLLKGSTAQTRLLLSSPCPAEDLPHDVQPNSIPSRGRGVYGDDGTHGITVMLECDMATRRTGKARQVLKLAVRYCGRKGRAVEVIC